MCFVSYYLCYYLFTLSHVKVTACYIWWQQLILACFCYLHLERADIKMLMERLRSVGCCCPVLAFTSIHLYTVPSRFSRCCYNVLVLHRIWWNTTSSTHWRRVLAVLTPLYRCPIGNFQKKTCTEPLSKLAMVSLLWVLWQHMIVESNSLHLFCSVRGTGLLEPSPAKLWFGVLPCFSRWTKHSMKTYILIK